MSDQDQTKRRLLDAAGGEFAEKGFEGATVRSICERAGVNLAAVNYHFGGKEALYERAVIEAHRCGADPLEIDALPDGDPSAFLRGLIRHFLSHVLEAREKDHWHNVLMMRELVQPTSACEALVREFIRPKFERLVAIMGTVLPESTERTRHMVVFSIIGQCMHYRIARPIIVRLIGADAYDGFSLDAVTDHITGFTLAALGLAPPLNAGRIPGDDDQGGGTGVPSIRRGAGQ